MADIGVAYDARALEYIDLFGTIEQMPQHDRDAIETWRATVTGRLLDAGCGPGHWTARLAEGSSGEVVGIDASAEFLAAARDRFPEITFHQADLAAIPLADGSVGGVLAWFSIIHTPPADLPAILAELARVLTPGGSAMIGFFDGTPGEPFDHAVHQAFYWSTDALTDLLAPHDLQVTHSSSRHDPPARPQAHLIATRTP